MNPNFLDFEQPIADMEAKIQELRHVSSENAIDLEEEISRLRQKCADRTRTIFSRLTAWQISQLARHPQRPYSNDYIAALFTDFRELHGDRAFADDHAIVGGIARFENRAVMVLGHQKGRDTKAKIARNFGMPRPEGYRKAQRLMRMAEKFQLPVFTFIDTPGAYPGIGAEERGQSEAIANSLALMSGLRVPILATVIGEGGSGGALAIGVADCVTMLQYSTYAVISPEGCASILWKSAEQASVAAQALGITSEKLHELGLIDAIVQEPLGGAHRDPQSVYSALQQHLSTALQDLDKLDQDALLHRRYQRLMAYGRYDQ